MSPTWIVDEARGRRPLSPAAFPLVLGGPGSDIVVAGDGEALAYLGLAEGDLFVQPAGPGSVACNGASLTASQWLRDGDVLRLGASSIDVRRNAAETLLLVRPAAAGERPAPPRLTPPPRSPDTSLAPGPLITPIDFQPSSRGVRRRRRRVRLVGLAVALGLVLLVSAAGFLFAARTLNLETVPSEATVSFPATWLRLTLGDRLLLLPGSHPVIADSPGYQRLETVLEVGFERQQTARLELAPLPGELTLRLASPAGSLAGTALRVSVDGVLQSPAVENDGEAALRLGPLALAPGEHELEIAAARFAPVVSRVTVDAGAQQELAVDLVPLWAEVDFASEPAGARVRLAGSELGRTPLTDEVLAGSHIYELLLPGYKPYRGRLEVTARVSQTLPVVTLQPSDGNLVVTSEPSAAAVTVDGVFRGETPLDLYLPPGGPYDVQVSKAGYEAAVRPVEVKAGESREVRLELVAREGEIEILAFPPDAELFVDGEPRGAARQTLRLPAVAQEIEVRKAGFVPFRRAVTPLPGVPQKVEVTLTPEPKATATTVPAATPLPPVLTSPEGFELLRVDPGRFTLGAPRREPGRRANEAERDVELTRPFYLAVREVTNEQFRRFHPEHVSGEVGGRHLERSDHPVVRVSWQEAAAYCNWLSEKEGLAPAYVERGAGLMPVTPPVAGYRLPTEAEWAWAARFPGGQGPRKYPWGDALPVLPRSGNYADVSAKGLLPTVLPDYDDGFPATAPVGSFPSDRHGFFDLGGNVAEWVQDFYAISLAGAGGAPERDPRGPAAGDLHVIRGAGWMHGTVSELRLTYREAGDEGRPDVGFRIARDAP